MAMPPTITAMRHAYADGQFKRMLINGEWVKAASGKTFESRNPATGDLLATVAEGDAEDINRAVAAARRAFEGQWSKAKPFERAHRPPRRHCCIRTGARFAPAPCGATSLPQQAVASSRGDETLHSDGTRIPLRGSERGLAYPASNQPVCPQAIKAGFATVSLRF